MGYPSPVAISASATAGGCTSTTGPCIGRAVSMGTTSAATRRWPAFGGSGTATPRRRSESLRGGFSATPRTPWVSRTILVGSQHGLRSTNAVACRPPAGGLSPVAFDASTGSTCHAARRVAQGEPADLSNLWRVAHSASDPPAFRGTVRHSPLLAGHDAPLAWRTSVEEVPGAGEVHGEAGLMCGGDDHLVPHRSAGLYD